MKIRRIPVPTEYDTIPGHRDIAERSFLRALQQEKARGPAVPPPVPRRASTLGPAARSRVQGQSFGQAFAPLSRAVYNQASDYTRAIDRGVREVQRREDEAREAAQDPDALRAMGFPGRDDDEDLY